MSPRLIFALDSGGRPYDFDGAQTDNPLEPRATWAFSFPNESTLGKYVAFASYASLSEHSPGTLLKLHVVDREVRRAARFA